MILFSDKKLTLKSRKNGVKNMAGKQTISKSVKLNKKIKADALQHIKTVKNRFISTMNTKKE
ncbi:hypothetical protein C0W44_19080 [Photobacterium leiognathi subsp. mandapamensis]|nr:hypothetical protein C0W44_19080 [Photobacterium leiognathi subsp. mandapamensis]